MKAENFRKDFIYNYVASNPKETFYGIRRGLKRLGIKLGKRSLLKRLRYYAEKK